MLPAAVLELVQKLCRAAETGNVATTVSACADQP